MQHNNLLPPFENPVDDSQRVFRNLLKSLSEPGHIVSVPNTANSQDLGDEKVFMTTWSIARCLFDHDTVIYLSPALKSESLVSSLQFQTAAIITESPAEANFALVSLEELSDINIFNLGSLQKPHESCSVIVQVASVSNRDTIEIAGPGIKTSKMIDIAGITEAQIELIRTNQSLYPCGVDFIFCSPESMLALPRTTCINTYDTNTYDNNNCDINHCATGTGETACM